MNYNIGFYNNTNYTFQAQAQANMFSFQTQQLPFNAPQKILTFSEYQRVQQQSNPTLPSIPFSKERREYIIPPPAQVLRPFLTHANRHLFPSSSSNQRSVRSSSSNCNPPHCIRTILIPKVTLPMMRTPTNPNLAPNNHQQAKILLYKELNDPYPKRFVLMGERNRFPLIKIEGIPKKMTRDMVCNLFNKTVGIELYSMSNLERSTENESQHLYTLAEELLLDHLQEITPHLLFEETGVMIPYLEKDRKSLKF